MAKEDKNFYKKRAFTLPKTTKLTEEIVQQLDYILDFAEPEKYRNTLIEIYHSYICKEHDSLPYDFDGMADQMYFLIDFLKRAGEEIREAERRISLKKKHRRQ